MTILVLALMLSSFRLAGGPASAQTSDRPAAAELTLAQVAQDQGHCGEFLSAVHAAGLDGWLSGRKKYTMFMPDDMAFRRLPAGVHAALLQPQNKRLLIVTLKHHVLAGERAANGNPASRTVRTLDGARVGLSAAGGAPAQFGPARVVDGARSAANGVIYEIDEVLIPASVADALASQNPGLATQTPALQLAEPSR